MFSILTTLLNNEQVTIKALAKEFEVSTKTIQRDIEALNRAGIPLYSQLGRHGGIRLLEGYSLDRIFLKKDELEDILSGLSGLGSVFPSSKGNPLIQRFLAMGAQKQSSIDINLSSHYKPDIQDKFSLLRQSIKNNHLLRFDYFSGKGRLVRSVEPYFILYRWDDWYLYAYCLGANDYRLFKIRRMWDIEEGEEHFTLRLKSSKDLNLEEYFTEENKVQIIFDKSVEYIIAEEFGIASYSEYDKEHILFERGYTDYSFLLRWVLGFGSHAQVVHPVKLKQAIWEHSVKIMERK